MQGQTSRWANPRSRDLLHGRAYLRIDTGSNGLQISPVSLRSVETLTRIFGKLGLGWNGARTEHHAGTPATDHTDRSHSFVGAVEVLA